MSVATDDTGRRMRAVIAALAGKRFELEDEKRTQAGIHAALAAALGGAFVHREQRIKGGIIDFIVDGQGPGTIGVEVKLKGQPRAIREQLARYAQEPGLAGLVLVSARPLPLPATLHGKPLAVVDLGRAWL